MFCRTDCSPRVTWNLAVLLHDVCSEWKIEDKNPALVTDNAKSTTPTGAGAKMKWAHTLNLELQKALTSTKVRKLLTRFHKSP